MNIPATPQSDAVPGLVASPRSPLSPRVEMARFDRLVKHGFEATVLLDSAGTILYSTPATVDLMGYSPDELDGRNAFQFIHPDDRAFVIAQLRQILETPGAIILISARVLHKDGTYRQLVGNFKNSQDPEVGAIVVNIREAGGQTGIDRDIVFQAGLIENAPDAIIATDMHRRIKSWNRAAEEIYGWTAAEAMGQNIDELLNSNGGPAQLASLWHEITARGTWQGRVVQHNRDGASIHIMASVRMLYDLHAAPIGFVLINRDITALARAESINKRNDQLLGLFLEHTPAAIAIFDTNMRYLAASRRYLEDYRLGDVEVVGRSHYEIFPEIPERWVLIHRRCLAGATEHSEQDAFPRKDGTTDWVRWELIPWRREAGDVGGLILFSELITARIHAEHEIRALNTSLETRVAERTSELAAAIQELESFSYSVSHDLRAPLRHVAGYVELLQKHAGPQLDEKNRRYLNVISEATARMGNLVDDLLEFTRMGRTELRKSTFEMGQLVQDVLAMFETEIGERDIEWSIRALPVVYADRSMLRRVWVNLIGNALKYTRPRAHTLIEIGLLSKEGEAVFFIRDNGVGFDDTYIDKLFGVFQRLHTAAQFEGTGIGLASVRNIIHRHGGRVWAESQVNDGAAFFFTLP